MTIDIQRDADSGVASPFGYDIYRLTVH
jgi:hypothetical protein